MNSTSYKTPTSGRTWRRARQIAVITLLTGMTVGGLIAADRVGLFGSKPTPDWEKYDGKTILVSRDVDGDTIHLDMPDRGKVFTIVRLWGVDTPETKKPNTPVQWYGHEASEFTSGLVEGKKVRIELEKGKDTRDKYGRLLAWVYLEDGRLLNQELIAQGYGYADPRFAHHLDKEFARLQAKAMHDKRGLWQNGTPPKDLPYYYAEGKHKLPE